MAIPDFQTIMLPLLQWASDGQEHHIKEAKDAMAVHFGVTQAERDEMLPSGRQPLLDNRVAWAKSYLKQAQLVEITKRGYFRITERGKELLQGPPDRITISYLGRYPEFVEFKQGKSQSDEQAPPTPDQDETTPDEAIENAYQLLRQDLAKALLEQIKSCSPAFFERLVVDLLLQMGYGGSRSDAGKAIGRSGDGGIDGIIKEDKLGLEALYIQAKRWEGVVGRPEIQKFAGALAVQKSKKGVFITTSSFTKEALEYAAQIDTRIVLVDGERLAQLMIDHNVGVSPTTVYELKRIDSDYFEEE
jgi:restriction system protein